MSRTRYWIARNWIDGHCHLADPRIVGELDGILDRARQSGVTAWVQGGVGPDDWRRQAELAQRWPNAFFPSYGLHPWWVAEHSEEDCERALDRLRSLASQGVALGEIGLDYGRHGPEPTRPLQEAVFKKQLLLARELGLPVILHIVKAHENTLGILEEISEETGSLESGGIVHSYSGSAPQGRRYLALGLGLSFSGGLTRKGFESAKKAVLEVPLDRFILETDSHEPASLLEIAEAASVLRGETPERLLESSRENLVRIFRLKRGSSDV